METVYYIVLIPMVYVAFAFFFVGNVIRLVKIFRTPKNPTTLQIFPEKHPKGLWALLDTFLLPTVRRHNPLLWVFLMIFHISFLFLIMGHLELIGEIPILQIIEHNVFLGKGFVGLAVCVALLFFLFRRFVTPNRELSIPEDYYLLILLFLAAFFGSEMDWARTWYEYEGISLDDYREYLSSLLYLRPEVPTSLELSGHAFMLVSHVFFANLFLIFFPFSKIMHSFFSLPMNKLRRG